MVDILIVIVHDIVQCITMFYCIDKLLGEKTNFRSFKTIFIFIIFSILVRINWEYTSSYVTTLFSYTLIATTNYYLREHKNVNKAVSTTFVYFLMAMVSELLISFILMIFMSGKEILAITNHFTHKNILSIVIYTGTVFVAYFSIFKKIYEKILEIIEKTKIVPVLLAILLFTTIFNMSYVVVYYNKNIIMRLFSNALFIIVYFILLIKSFDIKIKYKEVKTKYTNTLDALKDYEKIMDVYKVNNHENKNNFLTIRHMLGPENQKVKDFIDNIVDNKIMDDEKLNMESSNIPEGGIRAVIYSKLLEMKSEKIKFDLETEFKIRLFDIDSISDKTVLDICNVLGVFLDNAIHESKNLKDKAYIKVTLTMKNENLVISVKNKFKGAIDITKIDKEGYTTKGSGHGYGLSLVKNLLKNNKQLENKRKITKSTFEQILIIKPNKNSI